MANEREKKIYVVVETDTRRQIENSQILADYGTVFDARTISELLQIREREQRIDAVFIASKTPMLRDTITKIKQQVKTEIYVVGDLDPDLLQEIFYIGVRDIISHPIIPKEIGLHQKRRALPEIQREGGRIDVDFGVSPITREKIVVVTSPKGGTGKTSFATQCGAVLARIVGQTVLIDADYRGNAYRVAGKREMSNSIAEFEEERSQHLDLHNLESKLVVHESGLKILPSPWNVMTQVPSRMMVNAMLAYRRFYSMMVLDLHDGYTPNADEAAEYASDLIIMTTSDEDHLERLVEMLQRFLAKNVDPMKMRIIVNRATEADTQHIRLAVSKLKLDIPIHTLPDAPKEFANRKKNLPVFADAKRSEYSREFRKIMREMGIQSKGKANSPADSQQKKAVMDEPRESSKGLLKRLLGRGKE